MPGSCDLASAGDFGEDLEDEGDVAGYPREGLCLAVLGDGRAHPAWLCRARQGGAGRRRVVIYGDRRGASRALNPSERVDALPGDGALCARLQQDWRDASPSDRDGLLRALDELEARRCAPDAFVAMVKAARRQYRSGPMAAFAPSACVGREFYPNLFPPRVGDAVRVGAGKGCETPNFKPLLSRSVSTRFG